MYEFAIAMVIGYLIYVAQDIYNNATDPDL